MKDRPILRPNAISPNEWDNLSRENQIQWWKDHSTPTKPSHPLRAITLYKKGMIAKSEIPIFVFERLTVDNVREFIEGCPTELLTLLQAKAKKLPADDDDDGWKNVIIHHGAKYAPWIPMEDIREAEEESDRRYREGRVLEVLPDGTMKPYMVWRSFRGWYSDDTGRDEG